MTQILHLPESKMRRLFAATYPLADQAHVPQHPLLTRVYVTSHAGAVYAMASNRYIVGIQRIEDSFVAEGLTGAIHWSSARDVVRKREDRVELISPDDDDWIDPVPFASIVYRALTPETSRPLIVGALDPTTIAALAPACKANGIPGYEARWTTSVATDDVDNERANHIGVTIGPDFAATLISVKQPNESFIPEWLSNIAQV